MALSLFLARFLGIILIIHCLAIIKNRKNIAGIAQHFNPALIFISGFVSVILGTFLVLAHNLWVADWRVIITLLAWLILIKGILRLFFPEKIMGWAARFANQRTILIASGIFLIIGTYLLRMSFIITP